MTAEVTRAGAMLHLRLVGRAARPVAVTYTLVCQSRGNSVAQSGNATLAPDTPVTLLEVSQTAGPDWTGQLGITLGDGTRYKIAIPPPS